jgi:D-alanyl-D-alanine carboxypeptidase/D-alanyl-D-alanine-endopeptidase (penicillin-binding protein 4)
MPSPAAVVREVPPASPPPKVIDNADSMRIDSLLSLSPSTGSLPKRIDFFSRWFLEAPFDSEGPTGEGRFDTVDTAPVCNLHAFDCLTYVEQVLALALSKTAEDFSRNLVRLRYKDGVIDYLHRNHFFETDWLANNRDLVALIPPKTGVPVTRTISKKSFFARRHLSVSIPDTVVSVHAWSVDEFCTALGDSSIAPGMYIVAFIKKNYRSVLVNHVGFAVVTHPVAYFRDASKTRRSVHQTGLEWYVRHNAERLEGLLLVRITTDSRAEVASVPPEILTPSD